MRSLGYRVPRGPAPSTAANPANLTRREALVLTLLAQGLTNQEIADRHFRSVRTIDHHVSAVLAKLEVSNRVEAAQAASRLGDWRLEGCTLFVTKEPCPMCSGATLMARLQRVCYAVPDPKMGCLGGATNLNDLARVNHHCELTAGGVLEDECRDLLQAFFRLKRTQSA